MKALTLVLALAGAAHANRNLQDCEDNDLGCWAEVLTAQVVEIEAINDRITTSELSKIDGLVSEYNEVWSTVNTVDSLIDTIRPVMDVASKLPYGVGSAISPILLGIKAVDSPMDQLEERVNDLKSKLIDPWHRTFNQVSDILLAAVDNAGTFAVLAKQASTAWEMECLRSILVSVTPPLNPAMQALTGLAKELAQKVDAVLNQIRNLLTALSSETWRTMENGLEQAKTAINGLASKVDVFEPISSLMQRPITIPWLPSTRAKKTIGLSCPSNYEKSKTGLVCYEKCRSGYGGAELTCLSRCPSGYRDLGATCSNRNYYTRRIRRAKVSWRGTSCDRGWERKRGVFCWENCRSGYSKIDLGAFGACFKGCPNGMRLDPTKKLCFKKTYKRKSTKPTCPSGYSYTGVSCLEKCRSDEKDTGLFCEKPAKKTFTVASIADGVKKLLEPISKLPLISEVEKLLENALKAILSPILNAIGLGLDDLPTVPLDKIQEVLLPVDNTLDLLRGVDTLQFQALQSLASAGDILPNLGIKFSHPFGSDCEDLECMLAKVNAPQELLQVRDILSSIPDDELVDGYASLLAGLKECVEYEEIEIPASVLERMGAGNLGSSCVPTVPVCKRLNVDESVLSSGFEKMNPLLDAIRGKLKPGTGISLPTIKLSNVADISVRADGLGATFSLNAFNRGKHAGEMAANFLTFTPDVELISRVVTHSDNSVGLVLRLRVVISDVLYNRVNGKSVDVADAMRAHLLEAVSEAEEIAKRLDLQFAIEDLDGPGCDCSATKELIHERCEGLCEQIEKVKNPAQWGEWSTGEKRTIPEFLEAYPRDSVFWESKQGIKMASKMLSHMAGLERDLRQTFSTFRETVQDAVDKALDAMEKAPEVLKQQLLSGSRPGRKTISFLGSRLFKNVGFVGGPSSSGWYTGAVLKANLPTVGYFKIKAWKYIDDIESTSDFPAIDISSKDSSAGVQLYKSTSGGVTVGFESDDLVSIKFP